MTDKESIEIALSPIADDALLALADAAEKRIEALIRIKELSLKLTSPRDWVSISGMPYLETSGCEKVARLFGISWRSLGQPILEWEEGGHFNYTYEMEFSLRGDTIEAIGVRSSKDGFFKKYDWSPIPGQDGKKTKFELPASEIDRGDVKKSAYTNCLHNGITRILGIRNLTWEDLKAANIDRSQVKGYDHKEAGETKKTSTIKNPDAKSTESQIWAINAKLDMAGIKDEMERCEKVSVMAGIEKVITKISEKTITKGQASQVIEALNKGV